MSTASLAKSEYETANRSWYKRNEISVTPWLFLLPAILFFLVYVIIPIFQSFEISLFAWDGLGAREYIGTENYVELWDDPAFYTSLKNNLIWLILYLLAIPAGSVHRPFSEPDGHGNQALQVTVLFSVRYQPSGRRPGLYLVLRSDFRSVQYGHRLGRTGSDQCSG